MRRPLLLLLTSATLAFSVGCYVRARTTVSSDHPRGQGRTTGSRTTTQADPSRRPAEAPPPPPSAGCTTSAQCGDGMTCTGEPGCGEPWTCQPARPCTRDLVVFCSCDGESFRASSTCPGRPVRHRGPCEGAPPPPSPPAGTVTGPRPTPGGIQPTPAEVGTVGDDSSPVAPGGRCTQSSDCTADHMCLGNEGCSNGMTCQPRRPCTRDLALFCGCDGEVFRSSSSCPSAPFINRGPCQSDAPSPSPPRR